MHGSQKLSFQRALVVANPVSGQNDPDETVASLEEALDQAGLSHEVRLTGGPGDAGRWAAGAAAEGFDLLVVSGGDGTVTECAGGIVRNNSDVTILVVPNGTANVIANVAGIPTSISDALALLETGQVRQFDVGYVPAKDRYFLLTIAIGYPAKVVVEAPRTMKDKFGLGAYFWAAVTNLWNPTVADFDISFDGNHHAATGHAALVSNMGILAMMGVELASQVIADDGKLDIYVAEGESPGEFLQAVSEFVAGQRNADHLSHFTTRSTTITTDPPLLVQADGEPLGETPITIEIREAALSMIVPEA